MDNTEQFRRSEVARINSEVQSDDDKAERERLEGIYGKGNVMTMDEAREKYEFIGFGAPYVSVRRKSDGKRGSLEFQHRPRFYFNFQALD